MKFILLMAAVVILLWLLRGSLRSRLRPPPPPPPEAAAPAMLEDMVACAQCGLHLPAPDALPGRGGMFCCEAHRATFERTDREA